MTVKETLNSTTALTPPSAPTRTAIYDIETDGLLDQLTVIHSLCIKIKETGEVFSCTNAAPRAMGYTSIEEGIKILENATTRVGHNIVKFDEKAIKKVYPSYDPKGGVFDTLLASQLIYSDMKERDYRRRDLLKGKHGQKRANELWPVNIVGRHGLDAWGIRLGEWKGDYMKIKAQELKDHFHAIHMAARETGLKVADCPPKKPTKAEIADYVWSTWNVEMQDYCEQDIVVTEKLYDKLSSMGYSQESLDLEHRFAVIIGMMEQGGYPFDRDGAERLEYVLIRRMAEIGQELQSSFPPWEVRTPFTPKANNATLGYVKGKLTHKVKTVTFNPGSRDHIADRLKNKYKWEPTEFTDTGKPKVDEDVLSKLDYPEAPLLTEAMMISKRLGQISEGQNAWLKQVTEDGLIHHEVTTNGAVTGRCTHKRPNVAQTPSVKVKEVSDFDPSTMELLHETDKGTYEVALLGSEGGYGAECRKLWGPPKGMKQVGADLSGLELRCLAHYMARYDKGAYAKELLEGDIHTANQMAAGLPTRGDAKTFIYAYLYGGGDGKIGEIVGAGPAEGKKLKATFLERTPALKAMREAVDVRVSPRLRKVIHLRDDQTGEKLYLKNGNPKLKTIYVKNDRFKGFLKGLDGRILPIRSPHSALNTLLQSAGAVIAKKATVMMFDEITRRGYIWGTDWALMAHVHDEVQCWARPEIAEEIGKIAVWAFEQAGLYYNFRCPVTGEYKIGDNWFDTH
jgi:DNA polymerase I-like protein with 3'-5' exonuclease and polymerase domains